MAVALSALLDAVGRLYVCEYTAELQPELPGPGEGSHAYIVWCGMGSGRVNDSNDKRTSVQL